MLSLLSWGQSARISAVGPQLHGRIMEPNQRNVCRALHRNCHWKCLVLTAMIDGCLAVVVWCQLVHSSYTNSHYYAMDKSKLKTAGPCDQGYNFIPVAFAIMLYVVYLMECWHCRTRLELLSQVDVDAVYEYVRRTRESQPVVWWRAVCYHYIRRTRQVTRYRNGDAVSTTQVYYERVNSHNSGSVFLYGDCGFKDISKKLVSLERYPVTKVRFSKAFVFANLQAANEFEDQRARFFQENEQRDDYMEVREGLDMTDVPFKDFMIAFSNPGDRPWYTTQWAFWISSLVALSWPFRVLVEYKTAYVHYQITKLFGTNYLSPSSQNYTGPLTRVSTMDSGDLEAAVRSSYVIVPSYSEALLMDPVNTRAHVLHDREGNLHIETRQRWRHSPGSNEALCNERVFPNYGALIREGMPLLVNQRSQSMNFAQTGPSVSNGAVPGGRPNPGNRSISIGSLAHLTRVGIYRTLEMTPEENAVEEPPPSYEVAVQMCVPLYQRLRQSASSVQRLAARLSRSSSREVSIQTASAAKDCDTLL